MIKIPAERREAARALARFVSSDVGRRTFELNEHVSGTPIFPADHNETVVSVMSRVSRDRGTAALVAVYFPDRDNSLEFIKLVADDGPALEPLVTGGESTIGMLADVLLKEERAMSLSVKRHITAGIFELASA